MALPKVKAFFDEFPFLELHVDPEKILSVKVGRWSSELLEKSTLSQNPWTEAFTSRNILLLDEKGGLVIKVGYKNEFLSRVRTIFFNVRIGLPLHSPFPETILDALRRNEPEAGKVYYAVVVVDEEVTVYKPPKGKNNILSLI